MSILQYNDACPQMTEVLYGISTGTVMDSRCRGSVGVPLWIRGAVEALGSRYGFVVPWKRWGPVMDSWCRGSVGVPLWIRGAVEAMGSRYGVVVQWKIWGSRYGVVLLGKLDWWIAVGAVMDLQVELKLTR